MTEAEWLQSEDVPKMLRWFRQEWPGTEANLDPLLRRYYLACCRRIWPLLRAPETRRAIEAAEQDLEGRVPPEVFRHAAWEAEGAIYPFHEGFGTDLGPDDVWAPYLADFRVGIDRMVREVEAIPRAESDSLVRLAANEAPIAPIQLLKEAATFAHSAVYSHTLRPRESIDQHHRFLDAPLLREMVGSPFH